MHEGWGETHTLGQAYESVGIRKTIRLHTGAKHTHAGVSARGWVRTFERV